MPFEVLKRIGTILSLLGSHSIYEIVAWEAAGVLVVTVVVAHHGELVIADLLQLGLRSVHNATLRFAVADAFVDIVNLATSSYGGY